MERKENWFKALLGYAGPQKVKFIWAIICSVISIISGIVPFYCLYRVIELFILGEALPENIVFWSVAALAFYVIKVGMFSLSTGLSHKVAFSVLTGLRKQIVENLLRAPMGAVQRLSVGEIKNMLVDKAEFIEPPLAHMVPEGAGHMVLPVVSLIALVSIDWRLGLAALVTFPVAIISMLLTFKISGESFVKYDKSNSYMNSTIVEYIEGIEVIKAFGKAGVSYEKYAGAINDFQKFVTEWMASTWITMKLSFAFFPSTLLGTLPMSLWLIKGGHISAAEGCLAVMLSMSMVSSLARLEVYTESIRQMKMTIEEIQEYLNMERLHENKENPEIKNYTVELKDVKFAYDGTKENQVLHGVNMTLPEGSFSALVGPSGSGKSTVAKLIARFWDVCEGQITIGGVAVRDIPLEQLSQLVSFVAQDNFLFNCSILENIRVGNPMATDEEVKEAARQAYCEEFILKLPNGYETTAGEAGKRLSGGEKQRVAIARMILKNAPIVILDEATAFTDPENEDKLQRSISALTKGKTLLVIAHRLSTISMADTIYLLENGRILSKGTQKELLDKSPLYQRMWQAHIGSKHWAVSSADPVKVVVKEGEVE